MAIRSQKGFPGGSRKRVTKAGDRVRIGNPSIEDLSVIETWRAGHRPVLNTFQAILRNRTRGTNVIVGQRHKRRRTIFDKLNRFPNMQLGRMDDVAGCRLIFQSIAELYEFRQNIHQARFKHKLRNSPEKYDYIINPKNSGYRGVHDVYEYDVNSVAGRDYKGLFIEIQYRTRYQHAWATCVEVVGHITENQPKFERGDNRYLNLFKHASEIIARAHEGMHSCLPELTDEQLVINFLELDNDLRLMHMLRGLNAADRLLEDDKNMILIIGTEVDDLEIYSYSDATTALRALFELEKDMPGKDLVLVKSDKPEDVREAFKNYFSDARDFIHLIEEGCQILSDRHALALT